MLNFKLLVAVITFGVFFANAEIFRSADNTEVIAIDNPNEDELIRLHLLSRAQKSIRIVAHIHDASEFGSKVTEVLRDRMSNGVTLSYIYEKVAASIGGDSSDKSVNLLRDASFYDGVRSQVFINRPLERLKTPFSIHDLFHEKIIIIDEGTPNETIITGGRNHDLHGVDFSDLTFVIRPIVPGRSYLGDSLKEHYSRILAIVQKYFNVEPPRLVKAKELASHAEIIAKSTSPVPTQKVLDIQKVLSQAPSTNDRLLPFQFRPRKSRLITNDLFKRITQMGLEKRFMVRPELTKTDITEYAAESIENAAKVTSSTYVAAFTEDISGAYTKMLMSGGRGVIYTNSPEAYAGKSPIRYFGLTYGALNLEAYMKYQGAVSKASANAGQVDMHLLDPARGKAQAGYVLNHKKLLLIEQKSGIKMVLTGSDNFNLNSAAKNSEMLVSFDDPRMYDYMEARLSAESEAYYAKVDMKMAEEIVNKRKRAANVCRRFFLSLF